MATPGENTWDEEVIDAPMTNDELEIIRRHRGNPNYQPTASFHPLHEGWTDTEVIVLAPFFQFQEPPSIEQIKEKMNQHPALEARPGRPYYTIGLEILARYCLRKAKHDRNPSWETLATQLRQREDLEEILDQ